MIVNIKPKHYVILGRKWFDKINGNTYHSVVVYEDGIKIGYNNFCYGYGGQYLQTASLIISNHLGEHDATESTAYSSLVKAMREYRDHFVIDCCDVSRRKDLHGGGK